MKPSFMLVLLVLVCALSASGAQAYDASCKLKYPIVMSHHWGMKRMCGSASADSTAPGCVESQAEKDAKLPPLIENAFEPGLRRDKADRYYRYYSKAIVDRLRNDCGNQVFLSDKPAFASYEVRARSLRNTVLHALAQTGAPKVILIGMSQGVQDARFMTTELFVSDEDPSLGSMRSKVAAVVSVVGEDGGAESASLLLDALYVANGGNWEDPSALGALFDEADASEVHWTRSVLLPNGQANLMNVLAEGCHGSCDLPDVESKWRTLLGSMVNLCTKYMRPSAIQSYTFSSAWAGLRAYVGFPESSWSERVTPAEEASNGVRYFSYQGAVRNGYYGWDAQSLLTFTAISAIAGLNDTHVSVTNQRFASSAPNFANRKLMYGAFGSRGYHHMWFSGRDDELYGPGVGSREAYPYDGSSADFYAQVARDLRNAGL